MTRLPGIPPIVKTVAALKSAIIDLRAGGKTIALVPTMGALHAGHLDLVRLAKSSADHVVVSIFVNPAQFAPHEDFDRYPRTLDTDGAALATEPASLIYAPTAAEMYPAGFATHIAVEGAARGLETDFRPHFFGGVATVCCKLFTQVAPDVAIFGEKDYQQLCVLKQMVRDLDLPLTIVGAPTRREADGLALSSRNAYLSADERRIAPALHRALRTCAAAIHTGTPVEAATITASRSLLSAGFAKVDYVAARHAETLEPPTPGAPLRLLAACWLGKTRLIDNIPV